MSTAPIARELDGPRWHETLTPGDVVSFRFPCADQGEKDLPPERPCLVLDVVIKGATVYALLAYGTQEKTHTGRGYETHVSRRRELRLAGLAHSTRFVGSNRIFVPLAHPGFVDVQNGSPVQGRLTGSAAQRMSAVRTRVIAEGDMARARRLVRSRKPVDPLWYENDQPGTSPSNAAGAISAHAKRFRL